MITKFNTGDKVMLHLPASIFSAVSKGETIYYIVLDKGNPFPWVIPEDMIEKIEEPPEDKEKQDG